MEKNSTKPPWETVQFQKTPQNVVFSSPEWTSIWKEEDHSTLNELKQLITPYEQTQIWETMKKISNPYELIFTHEAPHFPPSVAMVKPLSRSFFKMVEMLEVSQYFQSLAKQQNSIRSGHVAEGPGGFIEALSERGAMYKKPLQKALAMTLKPNSDNVPGWRRAYNFLKKHPEVVITYGSDGTGDIYHNENQQSFIEQASGRIHVYTADGGFDFSEDYSTQEKNVFPLLVASAKIGLQCLLPGGLFIMKLFDVFGHPTQYLLRLITSCFKDWVLYKPVTSRPCNSERYLICRGFRRCDRNVVNILAEMEIQHLENKFPDLSGGLCPWSVEEQAYLNSHIQTFTNAQCAVIQDTFAFDKVDITKFDWSTHLRYAQQWCSAFRIPGNLQQNAAVYRAFGYKTS